MKKVSVIVPVYNSSRYLKRCIDSIINQTYKNIELIIINDGSTDNSLEIINTYTDSRITLINQGNKGAYYSRNKGLKIAVGEYISFIDSDDFIYKNFYKTMIYFMEKNESDIVCCSFNKQKKKYIKNYNQHDALLEMIKLPSLYDVSIWNKIFKRNVVNNLEFKKFITSEDLLYCGEAFLNSKKVTYINEKLYNYTYNNKSLTRSKYHPSYSDRIESSHLLYEIISKKYADLETDFYSYHIFNIIGVINKMILSNYNIKSINKLLIDIKKGYKKVMKSNYSRKKKYQIKLLVRNYLLYKILIKLKNI